MLKQFWDEAELLLSYQYLKITIWAFGSEQFKVAALNSNFIRNAYQMGPLSLLFCLKITHKWISTWSIKQTWKHLILCFKVCYLSVAVLFSCWRMNVLGMLPVLSLSEFWRRSGIIYEVRLSRNMCTWSILNFIFCWLMTRVDHCLHATCSIAVCADD